jgi:hypothetical protein
MPIALLRYLHPSLQLRSQVCTLLLKSAALLYYLHLGLIAVASVCIFAFLASLA